MTNKSYNTQMNNIKIYVACHDNFYVPKNKYLYPIQVGTYFADEEIPGYIHDNTGDNISYKNKCYCELTALYWAWKNDDADYYGLFHYRRYLSFNEQHLENPSYYRTYERLDNNALTDMCLDEEHIQELVSQYDVIVPIANNIEVNFKNNYEQYCNSQYLHKRDIDIFIDVVKEKYSFLSPFVDAYMNSHFAYFCNIGIMKKQYFNEYCSILFDVLEEVEKRCDVTNYAVNDLRVFGHLSERLFGIMFNYWLSQNDVKTYKLRIANITHYDSPTFSPAFNTNNIAIALAANNYYSFYLGVTVQSIIDNADDNYNYDIIIIDGEIKKENITLIKNQIKEKKNISIRFFSANQLSGAANLSTKMHMSIETWYRLYLPNILKDYKKVIYLDCDLIVNNSLVELYNLNIEGHLVAAARDLPLIGLYSDGHFVDYFDNVLKLDKPRNYLQAGVLLINLELFRERYTLNELIELANSVDWKWLDQDVMNHLANQDLYILNQKWNVEVNRKNIRIDQIKLCPADMYFEYLNARKAPAIIHYSGEQKPWAYPHMDMAEYFWKYARNSEFYELILFRIMDAKSETLSNACTKKIDDKIVPIRNEINSIKRDIKTIQEPKKHLLKLLPYGSKRRIFVRRAVHFFDKYGGIIEHEYWTINSDVFMHNRITKNKLLKTFGLSNEYMKKMKSFKNRHKGDRCFIVCTGPSLKMEDLEHLKNEYTIGVNSIVRAYEKTSWRPTYYALVDLYAFGEYLKSADIPGEKLAEKAAFVHFRTQLKKPTGNEIYVPISYVNHTESNMKKGKIKFSSDPSVCVYDCFTVTNMAIQLAVYMGFKEIYIIGADCNYDPKQMHFIETNGIDDKQRNAAYLPGAVEMSIKGYIAAKKFSEKHNVHIFNATHGGKLEVFDRVDFDSIDFK